MPPIPLRVFFFIIDTEHVPISAISSTYYTNLRETGLARETTYNFLFGDFYKESIYLLVMPGDLFWM